ncbi:MAG: GAF domain-containing protein, partial [Chloroflexi bacterium]
DYIIKPFAVEDMLNAIERALTVTRLQREKEELTQRLISTNRQLEQRLHELNILYRIGKSITALTDPETMLERIVDAVLFVTNGDEGVLVLVDPKTGEARRHVTKQRLDQATGGGKRPRLNTGLLMATATREGGMVEIGKENILSVPLQLGKRMVGTLSVMRQTGPFSAYDEQLLRMLADYAAIALHNLQLVRLLHARKEQEKEQLKQLFERYVSPTVVERLLSRPDQLELGGHRQTLTVLFADVRGFSAFSTRISPEILIELLNQYLRVAAEAILSEQGTLDKFMGDAVMAFFNAPLPQPDHTLRAVRAAQKLLQKVELVHQYLPPEQRLEFGVGIDVGEAVVGNIGTSQLMNYTAIGDTVNKAKRLQENARGGQILVSQEVYFMLSGQVEARSVGDMHLKGQSRPETVYEVVAVRGSRRSG